MRRHYPKFATPAPNVLAADQRDPAGFGALGTAFLQALETRNFSPRTVTTRRRCLTTFVTWCAERGLTQPRQVTRPVLDRFQRWLFQLQQPTGRPLSWRTQMSYLNSVQALFRWLTRQGYLPSNPAADLDLPRQPRTLPAHVLTAAEAELILAQPDVATVLGLRDRAILETFYSTGIRRTELALLHWSDLQPIQGTLHIRHGKGGRSRLIPIGDRALAWLERYRTDSRPHLLAGPDDGTLFVSSSGQSFTVHGLSALVRKYVRSAGLGPIGSCHLFRHTCATLMLENGADLRFIQQMLGHALLSTTQIYTHVSIRQLKAVHTATHPARLTRSE